MAINHDAGGFVNSAVSRPLQPPLPTPNPRTTESIYIELTSENVQRSAYKGLSFQYSTYILSEPIDYYTGR